jgi:hypothetical protein
MTGSVVVILSEAKDLIDKTEQLRSIFLIVSIVRSSFSPVSGFAFRRIHPRKLMASRFFRLLFKPVDAERLLCASRLLYRIQTDVSPKKTSFKVAVIHAV